MGNSSSALRAARLSAALVLLLPSAGLCQNEDEAAQLSDPDLKAAVEKAEDENLEAAVFGSKKEIERGLGYIQGFLHSSRGYIPPVVSDIQMLVKAGPEGLHPLQEDIDALGLASQLLEAKTELVNEKAAAAGLAFPELDHEQLFLKRQGYRPRDRERDLRRAEADLGKADKKGKRGAAGATDGEKALLSALNDYLAEFINAHGTTVEILQRLHEEAPADKPGQLALQGLKGRVALMDADIANLGREIKMLQISFHMRGHQRAAFDAQR